MNHHDLLPPRVVNIFADAVKTACGNVNAAALLLANRVADQEDRIERLEAALRIQHSTAKHPFTPPDRLGNPPVLPTVHSDKVLACCSPTARNSTFTQQQANLHSNGSAGELS